MKLVIRGLIYTILLPWILMNVAIVTFIWALDPQERTWKKTWEDLE